MEVLFEKILEEVSEEISECSPEDLEEFFATFDNNDLDHAISDLPDHMIKTRLFCEFVTEGQHFIFQKVYQKVEEKEKEDGSN